MKIAVYTITRDRLEMTRKSLKALRTMAGCDIDLYVADNGSDEDMVRYLKHEKSEGRIHTLHLNKENVGQNIAANGLLDEMGEYGWVLRWDNDAMPRTRRFLKKLVRVAEKSMDNGVFGVFSPKITKLKNPPETQLLVNLDGKDLELVQILGGICRLHPARLFEDFRFSRFGPLGFGEAQEILKLCDDADIPMFRVPWLEVEHLHGEDGQIERWPEEFEWERREVGRYVSYGL